MGSEKLIPEFSHPVGMIAAHSGAWLRVLERHGVEFGCGGSKSLREACMECGADPVDVVGDLRAAVVEMLTQSADWNRAPLADLLSYIHEVHHDRLRTSLPAMLEQIRELARGSGLESGLYEGLGALRDAMAPHLQLEETVIFPAIRQFAQTGELSTQSETLQNWFQAMETDHQKFCRMLRLLPTPPHDLQPQMARFSHNLRVHFHLECNILMPRVLELAQALGREAV